MMRKLIRALGVITLLGLFSAPAFAKEITVRGRLQETVEPGGWVIWSNDQKYLVLNAHRFQNEKWFVKGAEVEAIGETKPDVMTTYMEGTPFEVRTMRPFAQGRVRRVRRKPKRVERSYQGIGNRRLDVEILRQTYFHCCPLVSAPLATGFYCGPFKNVSLERALVPPRGRTSPLSKHGVSVLTAFQAKERLVAFEAVAISRILWLPS